MLNGKYPPKEKKNIHLTYSSFLFFILLKVYLKNKDQWKVKYQ